MQEARASWNTLYMDKNGFECQLALRDEDENVLSERVAAITKRIKDSGGNPIIRRNGNSNQSNAGGSKPPSQRSSTACRSPWSSPPRS